MTAVLIAALQVTHIVVSILLIAIVLLQVRMQGMGSVFGQGSSTTRVRRGMEKTLFQFTIGLAAFFIILSLVSVIVQR